MSKRVYIVKGSEDGNIGVASNVKAAYRIAYEYQTGGCDGEKNKAKTLSYRHVCTVLKKSNYVNLDASYGMFGSANIEAFDMVSR